MTKVKGSSERQPHLHPEMADKKDARIEKHAKAYLDAEEDRKEASDRKRHAKGLLVKAMTDRGKVSYRRDGLEVVVDEGTVKLKVKAQPGPDVDRGEL